MRYRTLLVVAFLSVLTGCRGEEAPRQEIILESHEKTSTLGIELMCFKALPMEGQPVDQVNLEAASQAEVSKWIREHPDYESLNWSRPIFREGRAVYLVRKKQPSEQK